MARSPAVRPGNLNRALWWLDRRTLTLPALLLLALGALLGLLYGLHRLAAPGALGPGLGPWFSGNWVYWVDRPGLAVPPGVQAGLYTLDTTLAPGWQDWLGPLLISLAAAWLGAQARRNQAFLQLHPLNWSRVQAQRLLVAAGLLAAVAGLACGLAALRGHTPLVWLSSGEQTRYWIMAALLLWLRGLLVLALAALLAQLLPLVVAAVLPLLASVALLQTGGTSPLNGPTQGLGTTLPEWLRLTLVPAYTRAEFAQLANRDHVMPGEYQAFMIAHVPAHLAVVPGAAQIAVLLAVLAGLLALTLLLGRRQAS